MNLHLAPPPSVPAGPNQITHFAMQRPDFLRGEPIEREDEFRAFLKERFPTFDIDLAYMAETWMSAEQLIVPIVGTVGSGWQRSSDLKAVTQGTHLVMRRILDAVESYPGFSDVILF